MMDASTLLSVLRRRRVDLWIEDSRLKCSAPVGAIDAELRSALVDQKDEIVALLKADRSADRSVRATPVKSEQSASSTLQTICREVAVPVPVAPQRMAQFGMELRGCGFDLANCAKRLGVFPRL